MIVICSASYVSSDIRNYFGKIPPVFLPYQNSCLLTKQVEFLRKNFSNEEITLVLPEKYQLSRYQQVIISRLNIRIIKNNENKTLNESVKDAVSRIIDKSSKLIILHGDTLIGEFENIYSPDFIAFSSTSVNHSWKLIKKTSKKYYVWAGLFQFTNINKFLSCLRLSDSFELNVSAYFNHRHPFLKVNFWLDFGNINSFFKSRLNNYNSRHFNTLTFQLQSIKKTSNNSLKISNELNWYLNLPYQLRKYTPKIIKYKKKKNSYYEMEYIYGIPLNEILLYGNNDMIFWNKLLSKISLYLKESRLKKYTIDRVNQERYHLFSEKSILRWKEFSLSISCSNRIVLNSEIYDVNEIIHTCINKANSLPIIPGYLHGDLCFSNILYISNADDIKVIDPRGYYISEHEKYCSDLTYDIAKLSHSILGNYDFIIDNQFEISYDIFESQLSLEYNPLFENKVSSVFKTKKIIGDVTLETVMPIVILLFLSMLPLHNDSPKRQYALLSNALILYKSYII